MNTPLKLSTVTLDDLGDGQERIRNVRALVEYMEDCGTSGFPTIEAGQQGCRDIRIARRHLEELEAAEKE